MFAVQEQKISHFPFREASAIWLEQHRIYISHRTYTDYLEHLRRLNEFFANLPLDQIHIGHVREYQKLRLQSVGNEKINKEISALQQILKEAKLWKPLAEFYKPLRIDREGSGKSMTPEQERALLWATDQVGPRAELAAHCIRIILRFGRGLGRTETPSSAQCRFTKRSSSLACYQNSCPGPYRSNPQSRTGILPLAD
jgi:hypothetical protein